MISPKLFSDHPGNLLQKHGVFQLEVGVVPGNIFPVPHLVTLPWPPARASFLSLPSPIPLLLRGFLMGTRVVGRYFDPELTWGKIKITSRMS
jgi:hypothetical protein